MQEQETQFEEIEKEQKQNQFKLFDIYDVSDIKVEDPGMRRYINLSPKLVVVNSGRCAYVGRAINPSTLFLNSFIFSFT